MAVGGIDGRRRGNWKKSREQVTDSSWVSRLTRDGTADPVPRDSDGLDAFRFFFRNQMLRNERGRGNVMFPCLAEHGQVW